MAKVNVEIVTPEKKIASASVDEAIIPGGDGLFGVRPGHTPFLSVMQPGPLTLRDGANTQVYFVAGGFVQVSADKVLVLADFAEPATGIDAEGARRRLEEAQARLRALPPGDAQFEAEAAVVRRETVRMSVAGR